MATKNKASISAQEVCENTSCTQALFGVVIFCPYCGMRRQHREKVYAVGYKVESSETLILTDDVPAPDGGEASPSEAVPAPSPLTPVVDDKLIAAPVDTKLVIETRNNVPPIDPTKPGTKTKPRWGRYVLGMALLAIAWVLFAPSKTDACEAALAGITSESDPEKARPKALEAIRVCKGDKKENATALLKDLDRKIAVQKSCDVAIAKFKSLLGEGKLNEAYAVTKSKMKICTGSEAVQASSRELREVRQAVSAKMETFRMMLEAGDFSNARRVADEVQKMDRDNSAIAGMRASIARAELQSQAANQHTSSSTPPVVSGPATAQQSLVQSQRDNAAAEMAAVMLRDGEAALGQRRYSDAKALANSVLRVVPSSQARDLLTRATEAESRALRNDTTLR